jgi:serine/threonine protein phosphatase PrpC
MVVCPTCQHESVDRSFCDHCNSLLPRWGPTALPPAVRLEGRLVDCSGFHGAWPADAFLPLTIIADDFACRVYALDPSWWRDLGPQVERRAACACGVLAPLHVIRLDEGAVVVAESLPGAVNPLPALAPGEDESARLEQTLSACRILVSAMRSLHEAGLVWLNFDPRALEAAHGQLRITNLDLQVFPAGACPDNLRLSAAWSPPELWGFRTERIGPASDVFHLGLYAYYRLAGLLPDGFPGQGLDAFDFDIPPLRIYRPGLPPGIAPVVEHALARDTALRFASPAEFLHALEQAVERLRAPARLASGRLHWDCGSDTVIGRAHELTGLPNQDSHTMLSLGPDRALFIVADGVTTASVGSGDLASRITVDVLAQQLPARLAEATTPGQIESALAAAFLDAGAAILCQSLVEGVPPDIEPYELMSSTALVAYVHGDTLTLASVGDSRAYLVRDGQAELLTVDGDVRCVHLGEGAAPEAVRELGPEALALYSCLGVSERGPDGRLVCNPERMRPAVSHWQPRLGDVVVLCSDGLVEEGVFLDPADLARLVGEARLYEQEVLSLLIGQPPVPAVELARTFVAAARARHRDASPWEPQGCGDDVTCIVLVPHTRTP